MAIKLVVRKPDAVAKVVGRRDDVAYEQHRGGSGDLRHRVLNSRCYACKAIRSHCNRATRENRRWEMLRNRRKGRGFPHKWRGLITVFPRKIVNIWYCALLSQGSHRDAVRRLVRG